MQIIAILSVLSTSNLRYHSEPSPFHLPSYAYSFYALPMLRYSFDIPTISLHYSHDSLTL